MRYWPSGRPPPDDERVETDCPACGLHWVIHARLAGHGMRCECGTMIDVPKREAGMISYEKPSAIAPVSRSSLRRSRRVDPDQGYAKPPSPQETVLEVPTSMSMGANTLRHASLDTRRRWLGRGVLELALVVAAFWFPPLLIELFASGEGIIYLPLTGALSGLLVVLVGLPAAHYMFRPVRPAHIGYFAEAALVCIAAAGLAYLWVQFLQEHMDLGVSEVGLLQERLGVPWLIALYCFVPAVFEELAFRGLLMGRFATLLGRQGALLATTVAFALAHGITFGLPFHMFGGFYLGWLRLRSGSLLPCMLGHFVYNGVVIFVIG
ncbi:MAG: type II CAAX endopeptidase family protein [Planctomycetota bacterium]